MLKLTIKDILTKIQNQETFEAVSDDYFFTKKNTNKTIDFILSNLE